MVHQKNVITLSLFAFFIFIFISPAKADSVYAIPKHWGASELDVYEILEGNDEGKLDYRATYDLKYSGAGDVTIDAQSNYLFVTFENKDEIELINARTFLSEGTVTADKASNLAGIIFDYIDPNTTKLYTIDRGTNKLFVYDWDADEKELTLLPYSDSQDWYTLLPYNPEDDPVTACGLSLDESNGTLYISQFERHPSVVYSNIVYAYDPNISAPDPNDRFRCTRKIDLGENNNAVDIDVGVIGLPIVI